MALAEIGFGPDHVYVREGKIKYAGLPDDVAWRAGSVVMGRTSRQYCRTCFLASRAFATGSDARRVALDACLADRPLVHDCGIAR